MDLRSYLALLRRRKGLVVLTTLLCAAAALLASLSVTPTYRSSAKLLVLAKSNPKTGVSSAYEGALLSQQLVKSFAEMLESRTTAIAALRRTGIATHPAALQRRITAFPIPNTLLIDLSVDDEDPEMARRLTQGVARAFANNASSLQSGSAVRVSLVEPASRPIEPIRPRTKLNTALGLLAGLLLGLALAFTVEQLDRSLKTPEELETLTESPVLGAIPVFKASKLALPVEQKPRSIQAEAFRKLRANFSFLGIDREGICCVVTSPMSGDGKSTVTANLALALAQAGQRVILVEADLRKPSLHTIFGMEQRIGTTTVLLDQVEPEDALQWVEQRALGVLTSGLIPPNPSELLGSERMAELVQRLRRQADVVLLDSAPMLPVSDAMLVAQSADGVLLVARAGVTTREQLQAAAGACRKAHVKVLGAVLNATKVAEGEQSSYYNYYGGYEKRGRTVVVPESVPTIAANGRHLRDRQPALAAKRRLRGSRV